MAKRRKPAAQVKGPDWVPVKTIGKAGQGTPTGRLVVRLRAEAVGNIRTASLVEHAKSSGLSELDRALREAGSPRSEHWHH